MCRLVMYSYQSTCINRTNPHTHNILCVDWLCIHISPHVSIEPIHTHITFYVYIGYVFISVRMYQQNQSTHTTFYVQIGYVFISVYMYQQNQSIHTQNFMCRLVMYLSFVFYHPEACHMIGQNMQEVIVYIYVTNFNILVCIFFASVAYN